MEWASSYEWIAITAAGGYGNEALTYEWLGKHKLNFRRVIFTKGPEKGKEDIDLLIDDSVENYKGWNEIRGTSKGFLLMDRSYNQTPDEHIRRISNLGDLYKYDYVYANGSNSDYKLQALQKELFPN